MFKRNISYILMFIIVLFGFNMQVDAASNLSCVYNVGSQYSDIGIKKVWLIRNPEWFPAKKNKDPNRADLDTVVYVTEDENASTKIQPGTRQSEGWYDIFAYYDEKQNRNVTLNVEIFDVLAQDNGNTGYSIHTFATKYVYLGDLNVCPSYLYINKEDAFFIWEENKITFDFLLHQKLLSDKGGVVPEGGVGYSGEGITEIPELTCAYEGGFMFTQSNKGDIIYYQNYDANAKANSDGWMEVEFNFVDYSGQYSSEGEVDFFKSCPPVKTYDSFEAYNKIGAKLITNYDEVVEVISSAVVSDKDEYSNINSFSTACSNTQWTSKWIIDKNYSNSCLYTFEGSDSSGNKFCRVIQMNYDETKFESAASVIVTELDGKLPSNFYHKLKFGTSEIYKLYPNGVCPPTIYASFGKGLLFWEYELSLTNEPDFGGSYDTYYLKNYTSSLDEIYDSIIIGDPYEPTTCEELLSDEIKNYIKIGVNAVRVCVPIILLVLGTVDFAKAVFSGEDEMKKIQKKFIMRVILSVGFFLIPSALKLLLNIASSIWPSIDTTFCGIL